MPPAPLNQSLQTLNPTYIVNLGSIGRMQERSHGLIFALIEIMCLFVKQKKLSETLKTLKMKKTTSVFQEK